MPLLFPGTYQVIFDTGDDVLASAAPVSFYYFPTNYVVIGGGLFYLLGFFFLRVPSRERWNYARYLIYIPGILGLIPNLLLSLGQETLFKIYKTPWMGDILEIVFGLPWYAEPGVPLQVVTVCFLVWRAYRMKGTLARWMTIPVSTLLVVATWLEQGTVIHFLNYLSYGVLAALPIVVIHHISEKGMNLKRITTGLAVGIGLSFLVACDVRLAVSLAAVYLINRQGVTQFRMTTGILVGLCVFFFMLRFSITPFGGNILYALRFTSYSAVPFACLVLWNSWARDVAMGHYEED